MGNYVMEIIPKPKEGTATILKLDKSGWFSIVQGQGESDYLCGACSNPICKNVDRGQLIALVFICPNCGCYNVVRGT